MNNIYLVQRKSGNVIVSIMRNKSDDTYSFVNLTKNHICPCRFNSVEDAVKDMDEKILNGEISVYSKLEEMQNIKALEKQIPCKPEEYVPDFPYNIFSTQKCAKCGTPVIGKKISKYCSECGQKIDWGEE